MSMAGESAQFGLRERPPTPALRAFDLPPRLKPMLDRAKAGLADPFRGVAPGGGIEPGLFAIEKTGISLAPLLEAARSFVATLSTEQRKIACFAIDDEAWRKWSNIHPWLMRHGVCLADLRHEQREAALALLRESMSVAGYQSARDIMRLNEHALEITGKPEEYGEWLYWVSIFGTPSPSEPWGWQIDGHHLNVNGFVLARSARQISSPAMVVNSRRPRPQHADHHQDREPQPLLEENRASKRGGRRRGLCFPPQARQQAEAVEQRDSDHGQEQQDL
jgi:hypothetical protein